MKCKLGVFASSGWRGLTRLVLSVDGGMGTTTGLQQNAEEGEITKQDVTLADDSLVR